MGFGVQSSVLLSWFAAAFFFSIGPCECLSVGGLGCSGLGCWRRKGALRCEIVRGRRVQTQLFAKLLELWGVLLDPAVSPSHEQFGQLRKAIIKHK